MEKQIKSRKRVKEFAEVFNAEREVKAMCDLIPSETWEDITSTFLEPSCGTGNFLAEIYYRKLQRCGGGRMKVINFAKIDDVNKNCKLMLGGG